MAAQVGFAGLSPLARGNQGEHLPSLIPVGPIPARAGQPRWAALVGSSEWAYPRSRGATHKSADWWREAGGLSPLARGNR